MDKLIPYARQSVDDEDISAVIDTLRSDWLTTGPKVAEFEAAVATYTGSLHAVAVNSGTAALHSALNALGIGCGDEVILPSMTFLATANAVVYQGGTPVFADVLPDFLTIDPGSVANRITSRTKAVIAVDYAGQPCAYDELQSICDHAGCALVVDACHSLGAEYKDRRSGTLGVLNCLSFHPVKHITTGEGGMILTNEEVYAEKMRRFRNHGITIDAEKRRAGGTWYYEMRELGYNYRITDIQCALGISQLRKLPGWLEKRRSIADRYDKAFRRIRGVTPLKVLEYVRHAYHLYVVRLDPGIFNRAEVFKALREMSVLVNVHYIPVHLQPFYRTRFGTREGLCPEAEQAYEEILSLPMYPAMNDEEIQRVIAGLRRISSGQSDEC
jgi:perosamine synthetase